MQDKRSVVPIEPEDVDRWLYGSLGEAQPLVRLASAEAFAGEATSAPPRRTSKQASPTD